MSKHFFIQSKTKSEEKNCARCLEWTQLFLQDELNIAELLFTSGIWVLVHDEKKA